MPVLFASYPLPEQLNQLILRKTFDLDHLGPAGGAQRDRDVRTRHPRELGEEPDALLVGFPIHWWCGEIQLPRIAETPGDRRPFGARMHPYRETRHSTLVLRFATPAPTRASTTSKAMASSSQSWLEPSAFCVATVNV